MKCVRVTKRVSEKIQIYACGAVVLLSLWSTRNFYRFTNDRVRGNADVYLIAAQDRRFREAAFQVCAARTAGYISDQSADVQLGEVMYLRTRYGVAPCLVTEQSVNPQRLVLGNFSRPVDLARFANEHGLKVVRDFGGGVVLFKKGSS